MGGSPTVWLGTVSGSDLGPEGDFDDELEVPVAMGGQNEDADAYHSYHC